ncbi:MAG: tetratricopeptide repeat protein [Candidatus Omnitrophota bacterium]
MQDEKTTGRALRRPVVFLFTALCVICGLCPPFSGALADIADDFAKKGRESMRDNHFKQAVTYFEYALQSEPGNNTIKKNLSSAYCGIAAIYYRQGRYEDSINSILRAFKLTPGERFVREQLSTAYNNFALKLAETGKFEAALENIRQGLRHMPLDEVLKKNLYAILLEYSGYLQKDERYDKALEHALEAVSLIPKETGAYIVTGNLYYKQDKFTDALKYFKRALQLDPRNPDIKKRVESLERERPIESGFGTKTETCFKIRFDRDIGPEYAGIILDILDEAKRLLGEKYGMYSEEVVPVIIYDDRQFEQATDQPHWTQGLYDGKIRLRYQDISRDDKNLRRVLFHEYSHAALYLNFGAGMPIWLNEGFAQFNEPDTAITNSDKAFLSGYMKDNGPFSLELINDMFLQERTPPTIAAAYLQSRLFFSYLYEQYGPHKLARLFYELKRSRPWQKAFTKVYANSIDRIDSNFNKYLNSFLK